MPIRSSASKGPALSVNIRVHAGMELPPLPRTVVEVSDMLAGGKDGHDVLRLAEVVGSDPVVAGAVLRRINSAYYGRRRRIRTVHKAVMLLGFLEVANVVMASGMLTFEEVFEEADQVALFEQIMQAGIETAQYARAIASFLELPTEGAVYTAGLLHATGRLVLLYNQPDEYAALWHADESATLPSLEAEETIFGTNHAELGAQAAEAWHLADVVVQALRHYPSPDRIETEVHRSVAVTLDAALHAAQAAAGNGFDRGAALVASPPLERLAQMEETTPRAIAEAIEQCRTEVQDYVTLMMTHQPK